MFSVFDVLLKFDTYLRISMKTELLVAASITHRCFLITYNSTLPPYQILDYCTTWMQKNESLVTLTMHIKSRCIINVDQSQILTILETSSLQVDYFT